MMQDNSFSWERISLLARYYMPAIKKQLLIYLIIIAVYFGASVISQLPVWFSGLFMMVWGICQLGFSYMFYLSPIAFARYDDNALNVLIPARGSEKALFIIVYSLVIVPAFIVAVSAVFALIARLVPGCDINMFGTALGDADFIREAWNELFPQWSMLLYQITGYFWMISIVLYVVTASRSNKVIKAILATIIVPMISGIIAAIVGLIVVVYNKNFEKLFENIDTVPDKEGFALSLISGIGNWIASYQGLMVLIGIVCVVLTWRKICHRQV